MDCHHGTTQQCDCYQRGLADARKTVEAEYAAERMALSVLASSLADIADNVRIHVHPHDVERLDGFGSLPLEADPALVPGSVRIAVDAGTASRQH